MSDNLILYEPVESENGLSCPYPGCNKCVDVSKRTQLEAHIRSHRKRKRKNKNVPTVKLEEADDVKVEVIEIETADRNDDDHTEKVAEFEFSDGDKSGNEASRIRSKQTRMRKAATNDQNQNEQPDRHTDISKDEIIRCPVSECDQTFHAAFQIWDHIRHHQKAKWKKFHGLSNDASENNDAECVDFAVKIEGEPSETVTPAGPEEHNDDGMFIRSTDHENDPEIISPIDDETVKSEPDVKVEEINTERKEDWFYVRDEDSIKRMFVCKMCNAEYEYLHQLHRHAFACPYKDDIGHTKIKNLVRNQFVLPRSKFLTKVKIKPPKLIRTKGNFYCDICQQVSLWIPVSYGPYNFYRLYGISKNLNGVFSLQYSEFRL